MIREILIYPKDKDVLTQKSEDVNVEDITGEEIQQLIQDLKDTLSTSATGVGISAIQIGVPKRICIIRHNKKDYVVINPKVTKTRGSVLSSEGCLSAPNLYTKTMRHQKIWFNYLDENGKQRTADEGGMFSIIAQHEFDHFDGGCVVFDKSDEIEKQAEEVAKIAAGAKEETNE